MTNQSVSTTRQMQHSKGTIADTAEHIQQSKCNTVSASQQTKYVSLLSMKMRLKINQILLWAGPDQFPLILSWNSKWQFIKFCCGLCQTKASDFLFKFYKEYSRFCCRLAQTNFRWFVLLKTAWNSIRFWSGMPQNNFLRFSFKRLMANNKILLWAGPDKLQWIFHWDLNENRWDDGQGCPRPLSFDVLLTFKWKSKRFCFGTLQTNLSWFSIKILIKIQQILLWAGPERIQWFFYEDLNENRSDCALGCPRPISLDFLLTFKWRLNRFCFALPQTTFFLFSSKIWMKIHQILLWGVSDYFPMIF